jgi:hypothetical protein
MKVLTVTKGNETRRFAMDTVRSQHVITIDAALKPGQEAPHHHIPNHKHLLVIELRPIKSLDGEGKGQVVDFCQQFEWMFDERRQVDEAVTVDEV